MSILIQPGLIRVSRPGVDAATALEKDLLLSIGARVGQILGSGYAYLNAEDGGYWSGTAYFGPFARAPDALGYVLFQNGFAYAAPGALNLTTAGPSQFVRRWVTTDMVIGSSSIYIRGWQETQSVLPSAFVYVLYRKPFQG